MSKVSEEAIRTAAEGFAGIPADYRNLRIKDSMPNRDDWDEFNRRLCHKLKEHGCTTMEDQLDQFWENNGTLGEMIEYIDDDCGLS